MHIVRLTLALVATTVPAVAQDARGLAVERAVLAMRPGDHRWADDPTLPGPVSMVVSVPMQMAFVYRGQQLIGATTVSTGKPGKTTPIGEYTILQKRPFHRSNLYANAPMPFMQRLTWGGVALHAGNLPGFPASHGCIRIPTAFAEALFAVTRLGGQVAVVNDVIAFPAYRPAGEPPRIDPIGIDAMAVGDDRVSAGRGRSATDPAALDRPAY
ncbi:L,D-transpeptidase family protein [Sphingomonas sp. CFBP 13720]|uniref:L,D-transpeptidase family protein n=1 Tax=Sphingomonas sp. CFBP 13720 TaxID=2775302 RepID=UPI0017826E7D|nr:L,D-transpeptidase family protein [Sphingomonas sp. CFBP 13720]MBD8677076.1 L,D-transpeptidase family protein [Sphingomonas sp. CFBP 13720]